MKAKKKTVVKAQKRPKKMVALKRVKKSTSRGKTVDKKKVQKKYIYYFLPGKVNGNAKMKILLGGKGANLAEMARLGIPVPPGFTITTEVCKYFFETNGKYPAGLADEVQKAMEMVGNVVGRKFADPENPLLVSVRSGAPASMPGMMDTILNLGLNDEIVEGLIKATNDARFAYDAYRRFVMMYSDVVIDQVTGEGLKKKKYGLREEFERLFEEKKIQNGWKYDYEVPADILKELVHSFKAIVLEKTKAPFPENPWDQLWGAIGAVFKSWNNPRAIEYRRINKIPADWGTAANIQAMVFGNMGNDCATGVAFTRNPATGSPEFYGEWLPNAQGEDVVAGIRTPEKLDRQSGGEKSLEAVFPEIYKELLNIRNKLEKHFRDMQDIEFTIEKGKLWMLQTRAGKRTAFAALRIAVDMVREKLITKEEALMRIQPGELNQLLRPIFDPADKKKAIESGRLLAKGLPAGPGAASGKIVLEAERAIEAAKSGPVILVRSETSPEDIHGMRVACGILTQKGGMTSHAALVSRQMGKVCIVGCEEINVDEESRSITIKGKVFHEGDTLSIDGSTGEVIEGHIKTIPSEILQVIESKTLEPENAPTYQIFQQFMKWADSVRRLGVRANADTPQQARLAVSFGAEGIGLCRTEHMFFGEGKIDAMRRMIIAPDSESRKKALEVILPYQKEDFTGIFKEMNGRAVTIRTLDPPLHEFLPHEKEEIEKLAGIMGIDAEILKAKVEELKEFNPMLGHRGCRLGISYPEITYMQATAIFEAAIECYKEGIKVKPEIMIPLVGDVKELELQKEVVRKAAEEVFSRTGIKIKYAVGTMIEIPRAAITADAIAKEAEFFSFGTNDLTQTVMGISRDDSGTFLNKYLEEGVFKNDPFEVLDTVGVGEIIKIAVQKGRKTRPDLKVGICGEHGGEPSSIRFCHEAGLDYVSCSPYRIPIARLAAAQSVLVSKAKK